MTRANKTDNRELVREQFTKTAEVFGDFAVATRGAEAEKLAEMIRAGSADRVLDVACGPGTLSLRFAHQVRWVCGADLTPAILQRGKNSALKEGISNVDFALADANRLPFADGSFDVAVTSYAIHHMDAARVIAEMARVVRRGGRVGVVDIRVEENPAVAALNNRIERIRDASHTTTLRKSEFEALFESSNLLTLQQQIQENSRQFDHWLHVAGWHRGDAAYEEARRLMESTLENDGAGYHPRYESASPGGEQELMITNTVLLISGEKI